MRNLRTWLCKPLREKLPLFWYLIAFVQDLSNNRLGPLIIILFCSCERIIWELTLGISSFPSTEHRGITMHSREHLVTWWWVHFVIPLPNCLYSQCRRRHENGRIQGYRFTWIPPSWSRLATYQQTLAELADEHPLAQLSCAVMSDCPNLTLAMCALPIKWVVSGVTLGIIIMGVAFRKWVWSGKKTPLLIPWTSSWIIHVYTVI